MKIAAFDNVRIRFYLLHRKADQLDWAHIHSYFSANINKVKSKLIRGLIIRFWKLSKIKRADPTAGLSFDKSLFDETICGQGNKIKFISFDFSKMFLLQADINSNINLAYLIEIIRWHMIKNLLIFKVTNFKISTKCQ